MIIRFGILSALGGLAGAWLHSWAEGPALTLVFSALLIFAGGATLTGLAKRMRFGRRAAWVAGGISGLFGGLVGNQGGIRSAALLGFDIDRQAFVATATAIGIVVDAARMPVYVATEWRGMSQALGTIAVATLGVLVGTVWGVRLLRRIPDTLPRAMQGAVPYVNVGISYLMLVVATLAWLELSRGTVRPLLKVSAAAGPAIAAAGIGAFLIKGDADAFVLPDNVLASYACCSW